VSEVFEVRISGRYCHGQIFTVALWRVPGFSDMQALSEGQAPLYAKVDYDDGDEDYGA